MRTNPATTWDSESPATLNETYRNMSCPQTPEMAPRLGTARRKACCRPRTADGTEAGTPGLLRRAGLVLCLSLGLAWGTQAAEPDANRRPDEKAGKPATVEPPPKPKQKAPRPFVPTEKIKADSIISFPVDI